MNRYISLALISILLILSVSFAFADESYYIQSGAFEYKSNADKHVNHIKSLGLEAVVIKVHDFYKVFLGPYASEAEARAAKATFESSGGSGFLVLGSEMFNVVEPKPVKPSKPATPVVDKNEDTDPETADPETTDPETADPETADPETTDPETADPETADPETTDPEATDPETTDPETTDPETTDPETTDPDATEVEADEQDVSDSDDIDDKDEVVDNSGLPDIVSTKDLEDEPSDPEEQNYKLFTIILILVLWLLFILIVLAFRFNQNKKKSN